MFAILLFISRKLTDMQHFYFLTPTVRIIKKSFQKTVANEKQFFILHTYISLKLYILSYKPQTYHYKLLLFDCIADNRSSILFSSYLS